MRPPHQNTHFWRLLGDNVQCYFELIEVVVHLVAIVSFQRVEEYVSRPTVDGVLRAALYGVQEVVRDVADQHVAVLPRVAVEQLRHVGGMYAIDV